MDTCKQSSAAQTLSVPDTVAALKELAQDTSPLRRALKAHFVLYGGLLSPRVGPQEDDL